VLDDNAIEPGAEWEKEIKNALAKADAGVILVSPHSLASRYIFERELPELLQKPLYWIAYITASIRKLRLRNFRAATDKVQ